MAYNKKIMDIYHNPSNVGSFPKGEPHVGIGIVGAPACGDVMKLEMKINPNTGIIQEVRFKTFGCVSAIAASSYATELIKNKHVSEALKVTNSKIAQYLSLPPVKLHCSVLAAEAIQEAINNYKKNHGTELPECLASAAASEIHEESVSSDDQEQDNTDQESTEDEQEDSNQKED